MWTIPLSQSYLHYIPFSIQRYLFSFCLTRSYFLFDTRYIYMINITIILFELCFINGDHPLLLDWFHSLLVWPIEICIYQEEIYNIYSLGNTNIQLTKKRQNHCLLRKVSNLLLFLSIMSNCKLPKVINVLLLLLYTQKKIKCRQNVNSFNCHRKQRFSPLCQ